jgi:hypothetical protein
MKKHIAAAIGATVLAASLAACSSGISASTPTGSPSARARASAPVNNRTYVKADLATILNAANNKLALGGEVETRVGTDTEAVDALEALLDDGTVIFSPAACGRLIRSDAQLVAGLRDSDAISGALSSPQLNVIVTARSGATLPQSLTSHFTTRQNAFVRSCSHLSVSQSGADTTNSVAVTFEPLAVTTTASQAVGFTESYTAVGSGSGTSTRTTIEAISGNLVIFVSGVSSQDAPTLEKAVNAVVAAAAN